MKKLLNRQSKLVLRWFRTKERERKGDNSYIFVRKKLQQILMRDFDRSDYGKGLEGEIRFH